MPSADLALPTYFNNYFNINVNNNLFIFHNSIFIYFLKGYLSFGSACICDNSNANCTEQLAFRSGTQFFRLDYN